MMPKFVWARSAISFAMANEEVAAGEGAFRTVRVDFHSRGESYTKSSTSLPFLSKARARTPAALLLSKSF
jgi:hypothetical protein